MDIGIPGVFGVAEDRISVCLKLKIVGGAFLRTQCGIMSPRGVSFWRRPCPCQPKSQMIEDIPDHRRILNTADDPHSSVTSRTDQGISFVDFLD